jgi:hypothetical protein
MNDKDSGLTSTSNLKLFIEKQQTILPLLSLKRKRSTPGMVGWGLYLVFQKPV